MNSQQLFYFNLIIGAILLAYFIFGRAKEKRPTQLNLRAPDTSQPANEPSVMMRHMQQPKQSVLEPESKPADTNASKNLSIFFLYNGHDWEAHQVLGIPQGAGVDAATRAYQDQLKTADPSSFDFLELAYNAIFKKRRNERL